MFIPCHTCKQAGRCRDEEVTHREAVFVWLQGEQLGCVDHESKFYHGVEGVHDHDFNMESGGGRRAGRDNRFLGVWSPAYVGTR